MRQIISTAVVAVVVGAVAGATMGAVAQTPAQEPPQAIVPAVTSINAHKVDGRHAVSASASRKKRAGKLVATNRQGYLPANIIKPAWSLIRGKPPVLADNQVGWDELVGTAPKITLTTHFGSNADTTVGARTASATCPAPGKATGGGFYDVRVGNYLMDSSPVTPTTWQVKVDINDPGDVFYAYVTCMTAEPATLVARLTPAARNPKRDR